MNTINSSGNTAAILEQNQAAKIATKRVQEERQETEWSAPQERVEISEEARALAAANGAEVGENGSKEEMSSESSSSSRSDTAIETLEQQIEDLQEEISEARADSTGREEELAEIELKEALLTSYQAQLAALQSEG